MASLFSTIESDFEQYLKQDDKVSLNSSRNYISWLKFLSKEHVIDLDLNETRIEHILEQEEIKRKNRDHYVKEKDLKNFKSTLKKYFKFSTEYPSILKKAMDEEESKIKENLDIPETTKTALVESRRGQGRFRKELIAYWKGCSLSSFLEPKFLIASHIKPWKDSTNKERLDSYNGLLLLPNYDKLFDKGYMSFDNNGSIIYATDISEKDKKMLGLDDKMKLKLDKKHLKYLDYHRNNCFHK
jgi:putative restriction endonuclease